MNKDYNGFHVMDFEQTGRWWLRGCFVPTTEETGLIVLQHSKTLYPDVLNIGIVVGSDDVDAYEQLFNPSFDKTLGDSEILLRIATLLYESELLGLMRTTAIERGLRTLQIMGDRKFPFEDTLLNMFEDAGFSGENSLLHMDVNERNSR